MNARDGAFAEAAGRLAEPTATIELLRESIEHAAHLLPAQGPITVFIHHNTLHAFEDQPFDDGVKHGSQTFGCQPYLSEETYRTKLAQGRILPADIASVLRDDLLHRADEPILRCGTRLELRQTMLEHPLRMAPPAELRWFIAETEALERFREDVPAATRDRYIQETRRWIMRDFRNGTAKSEHPSRRDQHIRQALDGLFERFGATSVERWGEATWEAFSLQALWRVCREGVHGVKHAPAPASHYQRHRDLLFEACGVDSDRLVNELMIRFCAAFLDQGLAHWVLPNREQGFWACFLELFRPPGGPPDRWLRELPREISRLLRDGVDPLASVSESLDLLDISEDEWSPFISASFLALRGWAGMVHEVETRSDRVKHPIAEGSLVEYLAVRLILERLALAYVAGEQLGYHGSLRGLREYLRSKVAKPTTANVDQRAFMVFQMAQLLGWLPHELNELSKADWGTLLAEIESFPGLERRRLYHQAFERRYRIQTLDAIGTHSHGRYARKPHPAFQVICCLDEREESFRRHMEEINPDAETFGAAGFFNVPMYYRGAAAAHFVPLCPVIIRPQHWVIEDVAFSEEDRHRRRAITRRALGNASHRVHVGSRTFTGGAILAVLGVVASIPLVARVLFPRLTARIRRMAGEWLQPPDHTQLQLERTSLEPGQINGEIGFSVDEMTASAERLLRDIGLTSSFAPTIFLFGHGSSSVNNPHRSAYDCGACGGNAGGPNARAMAQVLNDPRVRKRLSERGIEIDEKTTFIGGLHNTCNDTIKYFDLDRLTKPQQAEYLAARAVIDDACERNAHERCRRFQSAPLTMDFPTAHRHVEERSEDLAQTRPECGHATNALCIVGRRSRTQGMYLDRRAFLTSYDPTLDDEQGTVLLRLLQAAVPVCGGINLEYYFSYVDPSGYGCGTKLPHNVTSLLGIMDGAASDLRTGLPWQMVEIHDPVRLLFIIETTAETMLGIMERNEIIGRTIRNGWVQLAILDPHSGKIQVYQNGHFTDYQPEKTELPTAPSSTDWYRGWREHLGYAKIESRNEDPHRNGVSARIGSAH